MRGRAGRARAIVWLVIAVLLVAASAAAAKDHGGAPAGKQHGGPPSGHVPPGHQPGGPHGNKPGHGSEAPAAAPEPAAPAASPPAPAASPPSPPADRATPRRSANRSRDGGARHPRGRSSDRSVHKAIRDLLPLEELAAGRPLAGGGGDSSASSGAAAKQTAPHSRNAAASEKTASDDGGTGRGSGSDSGSLPFTGLALLTLVLTGLVLVAVGSRLHRSARSAEPVVASPAPVPAAPVRAMRPEPDPMGGQKGRSVVALALVGLLGLTVLAVTRRPA